jgi:hypothetical protein
MDMLVRSFDWAASMVGLSPHQALLFPLAFAFGLLALGRLSAAGGGKWGGDKAQRSGALIVGLLAAAVCAGLLWTTFMVLPSPAEIALQTAQAG